jgi:hypothetical protein
MMLATLIKAVAAYGDHTCRNGLVSKVQLLQRSVIQRTSLSFRQGEFKAADRGGLLFLCNNSDQKKRLALIVGHLNLQFLARLEFAIYLLEQLSSGEGRFTPSCGVIRQFSALGVVTLAMMVDVEKISRHEK